MSQKRASARRQLQGANSSNDSSATVIEFQQHDANQGERFDPRRTGFEHMGFKVESRETLEDWQEHFI